MAYMQHRADLEAEVSDTSPRKRLPVRWLTLAEAVGILALVVAALGYWDSHRERTTQDRDRAEAARASALRQSFLLTGSSESSGERLRLTPVHAEQVIQTQTVWFPTAIRSDRVETTGNPRLEAGWIEDGLRKAAGKAKSGRVPVAVQTVFIEDGQTKTDRSVYFIGYSLHARMLRSDKATLEGLSLARRGVTGDLQAAVNGMWSPP
jgi:hypothetical protein